MTFRSLEMSQFQIIVPRDSAYHTINLLGYENALHLSDSADPANRAFSHMVKRCEECLQKIDIMIAAVRSQSLEVEEYDETEPLFVDNLRRGWREEAKTLGIDENRLIDVYEQRVTEEFRRFQDVSERLERMSSAMRQNLQKMACMEVLSQFLGNSRPKRQNHEYYINNVSEAQQVQSVSFLVGVVKSESEWKLAKMIYRVSKGYACTKTQDKFKFAGLKEFGKKAILVIYPSSDNKTLEKKLQRVMSTFCDNSYLQRELEASFKEAYQKMSNQYNYATSLQDMGRKEYKQFLQKVVSMKCIETWRIFLWKEKVLYEYLNRLDRRQQFYIANAYIPKKQVKRVCLLVNRIVPTPTMHETPLQLPPTAFETNSYTAIAQQITDTYGVSRYRQINPSIFTTVTFPFFFGVMFGDVAHGLMIFALGLYAISQHHKLQGGFLKILGQFRYMLTMMGFFAVFCGFIYNDLAGFNFNFFGSCFDPPYHPEGAEDTKQSRPIHSKPGCVYPFGIDPIWGRAQNQLVFVNSLKMKISVIIAIVHMSLGVCCKAANSLYFRKKLDFYFEFLPQFIFLVGLFGYMDFLIIFKWLKVWDERVGLIPPQQWAPSIISTMMNIGLDLGRTSSLPDGNSNMWGPRGKSSQDTLQLILLIVAFICVPVMLIPKPCIQIRKSKKKAKDMHSNPLANEEQNFYEESRNALEEKLNPKKEEKQQEENSSEIVVHQLIETIQFVLGTVSNTASYLRLWALSLAHSQLSKVFFQQTAGRFFGDDMYIEIPSLFIGSWLVMWITFAIILCMDSMECFLHSLRLHWVEFQNKFYKGDGYRYTPISFRDQILKNKLKL